jgi:hypothetical protein
MTRTYHDIWLELWQIGAPDNAIARICETHQTRIRKWRLGKKLPTVSGKIHRHQRWEEHHQTEIEEILERT